jgi:hypothetical protein
MTPARSIRNRPLLSWVAGVVLALGLLGCGASTSTRNAAATSRASASARAAWTAQAQRLCVEKVAAIQRLGDVHITYGGIARLGLPAVKGLLERYLARLQAVVREFHDRQLRLATPLPLAATIARAAALDLQSQAATTRLQTAAAHATTAAELAAAFQSWLTTLAQLAPSGNALAREAHLPLCEAGSSAGTT